MIDQVDELLKAWVAEVLGDTAFSLGAPADPHNGPAVSCYLLALAGNPPLRGPERAPLQFVLRYLVTAFAKTPQQAHRLLGQLVFAAMENPDWELEFEPLAADYWEAFKMPPQPSFVLRVPVQQERSESPPKRVLKPLEIGTAATATLRGILLGPGAIPLAGATIELLPQRRSTSTGPDGDFALPSVPAKPGILRLRIWAKGKEFKREVEWPVSGDEPVTVHIDSLD